jgi:acetyltransferase-like isoleucine patch superfamily enzyme
MSAKNIFKKGLGLVPAKINQLLFYLRYECTTVSEYYRKQGAIIGENCRIDSDSLGGHPYLVEIGNHVFVSQGVLFHTHDGGSWICREEVPDLDIFGKIIIEDNCVIGANSQLLPNIRIGKNSIVGAGSVVLSDVPPNSIVMGVPARVIGSTIKYKEKCFSTWNSQKPPFKLPKDPQKRNQILKKHLMQYYKDQPH